ncbi:uncharacterized protein LOC131007901 [Salvia miltiorrhiza]|uniref:uncharacterized protein LOC131007901 n=1 Tax=Salvia miltiorrhiza TaxID=226208 RepID=UPI0025ABD314|nr:uncharacterized protein LOC131007901 [Salvia miltiorrhiza]
MKYKTTESQYKLLLFKHTRVVELDDDTFPNHTFNIKNFGEISSISDVQNVVMFDIMGIVVSSYQPIIKDFNGQQTKLMDIIIEDLEGKTMTCTLWEQYADKMHEYLCTEPKMPICIIVQFCRPSIFRGEVCISSSYHVSKILFDENIVEIKKMKDNFIKLHKERSINLKLLAAPTIKTIEDEINEGSAKFMAISELTGKMRYRLRVYVADNSGGVSLSLWDRECLQLIGKPAEEIIYDPNSNELPIEIDAITNKNALFKIKVEESTIFDGAYVVTKINCDPNILNKYCGSIVESETKETQLKDKEIGNIKVQNDGGSSSFTV